MSRDTNKKVVYGVGGTFSSVVLGTWAMYDTDAVPAFHTDNYWEAYAYAAKMSKKTGKPIWNYATASPHWS